MALNSEDAKTLLRKAVALHQAGELTEAGALYEEVCRAEPSNPDALHYLGLIVRERGDAKGAAELMTRALALKDGDAAIHHHLAGVQRLLGDFEAAMAGDTRALELRPAYSEAHYTRAHTLKAMGRNDEAQADLEQALKLRPDWIEALCDLGVLHAELRRFPQALAAFDRALALSPDYVDVLYNRGKVLAELERHEEAVESYRRAVAIWPDMKFAQYNLGNELLRLGRHAEALEAYDRAVEADPDHADARWNRALALLAMGDLEAGFAAYEWRFRKPLPAPRHPRWARKIWNGREPIEGRTLLMASEQGFGDTIQFARYATLAARAGARVVLLVQVELVELLRGVEGVAEVTHRGRPVPPFDLYCSLLSAPMAFGTRLDTIPARPAYLKADGARLARWRERLGPARGRRVGIVWGGSTQHVNDRWRSVPLAELLATLPPGIEYVSLQKDTRPDDGALLDAAGVRRFESDLADFSETAALCELLDLVVTVDTSVGHLAGALGRPTWIMVTAVPDWRWLLDREDSPWYPTVRLLRQPKEGRWEPVLSRVGAELAAWAGVDAFVLLQEGLALHGEGKHAQAAARYRVVLRMQPDQPDAWHLLGVSLAMAREHEAALAHFARAIELKPGEAVFHLNRARALTELGRRDEALGDLDRAVALLPASVDVLVQRAALLRSLGRESEAILDYERALSVEPGNDKVLGKLAAALTLANRPVEAIAAFDRVLARFPGHPDASWNKGLALLLIGDYEAGWPLFEWRWKAPAVGMRLPPWPQPRWDGREPLRGRTLMLWCEQGLGDGIQFCRYAARLAADGARVLLYVHRPLLRVLRGVDGVADVVADGDPMPPFDLYVPAMSLPGILGTRVSTIPAPVSYLRAVPEVVAAWRARLGPAAGGRVGLVWAGSRDHPFDAKRSIALRDLLAQLPSGLAYVSLQKDLRDGDRELLDAAGVPHFGDALGDLADTAALCELVDLVVSVDTSVVHLAAAMGRPTWLLLATPGEWRWLRDREDSPWYPTMRILRQQSGTGWPGVLGRLHVALRQWQGATMTQVIEEALAAHGRGERMLAQARYEAVIAVEPSNCDAWHLLGVAQAQGEEQESAVASIARAIALKPDVVAFHLNQANVLLALGRLAEAAAGFARTFELDPNNMQALLRHAGALRRLRRFAEAAACLDRAIAVRPPSASLHFQRAMARKELGRYDEAIADYDEALRLRPGYGDAAFNKAFLYLLKGDYATGLPLYEGRWQVANGGRKPQLPHREWTGSEAVDRRRIFVYAEQGYGDTIQFSRYVTLLAARGATVLLNVQAPLLGLMRSLQGVAEVTTGMPAAHEFDMHAPLLSLPLAFGTRIDTVPAPVAYLRADDARIAAWTQRLGTSKKLRVGLVWRGAAGHADDAKRSLPLALLLSALPARHAYFSLQKDLDAAEASALEAHGGVQPLGGEFADFGDTAAVCALMDVVVCVDTSVAHLAAALGRPTWILLPYVPDWRWHLEREDSPWYPTARLFRQGEDAAWPGLLERLRAALEGLRAGRRAAMNTAKSPRKK
ncbi:tetratricopeptide repeat protein [Ramlibacter sp.]|uniref:tetratricopeptide repeat protein n=1 Tax=Ramlibacter sp. TaxID=1917967 RepID=UPI003D102DF7